MMKTYVVACQKGGSGKSTTAAALAAGIHEVLGEPPALAIDLDAQCNLTNTAGASIERGTTWDVMQGRRELDDIVQASKDGAFYIAPSTDEIYLADRIINDNMILNEALEPVRASSKYGAIVLDTPPHLGVMLISALAAADVCIIPIQAGTYHLHAVAKLFETIADIKQHLNPRLEVAGILLTRYKPRAILSKDMASMAADMAAQVGTRLFNTTIRDAIAIEEAQAMQENIYQYAPRARVTSDYKNFLHELVNE